MLAGELTFWGRQYAFPEGLMNTVVLKLHALLGHGLKCGAKIEEAIADLLVC